MSNPLLTFAAFAARVLPAPFKRALYRAGPLARLIRRGLNRAAPAGLSEVTIAAGGLAGMRMLLDMQEEKDYWLGTYETDLQTSIGELARPGMTAWDVGANVGYVTLLLARAVGPAGRVEAFEPFPANVERLRANVALNGLAEYVRVHPAAAAGISGGLRFLVGRSNDTGKAEGSAGRQENYPDSLEVAGLALDDFVYVEGNPPPQLVKMDIEGGEVLALPGMRRLLAQARPVLLLELHGPEAARAAWEILTACGYIICRMGRGFPPVAALEELDWKAYLAAMP